MTVNQFSIVPKILRQSDLVVAVVRRAITSPYASELMMKYHWQFSPVLSLLWHERLSHHPARVDALTTLGNLFRNIR